MIIKDKNFDDHYKPFERLEVAENPGDPIKPWPTTTVFQPWPKTTTQKPTEAGKIFTEEPRTKAFLMKIGGEYVTHPFYKVNKAISGVDYSQIKKSGPLPNLLPSDINFNNQWNGVDHDFLSSDEVEEGENDPKYFATVEPYTYKTVTPWVGWRAYKEAELNCSFGKINLADLYLPKRNETDARKLRKF